MLSPIGGMQPPDPGPQKGKENQNESGDHLYNGGCFKIGLQNRYTN